MTPKGKRLFGQISTGQWLEDQEDNPEEEEDRYVCGTGIRATKRKNEDRVDEKGEDHREEQEVVEEGMERK